MAGASDIEWTDATWNPVRGCVKVSPGCKHCYAETFAERFRGVAGHAYEQGFDPRLVPTALDWPLRNRGSLRIFVNSMSDLFGDWVPNEYVAAVYGVAAACPLHTFQVLTKRAERLPVFAAWLLERGGLGPYLRSIRVDGDRTIPRYFDRVMRTALTRHGQRHRSMDDPWMQVFNAAACTGGTAPLYNIHLGVSVEDRKYGVPRIEHLRNTPAAVRFLSIEPLLEDLGELDLRGIDWVIVGGESGLGARPMHPDWVRSIRDQCVAAGVPFFFKQWGGVRKKAAGRELDGRTWDEMPAVRS